jgi:hypothetical protein
VKRVRIFRLLRPPWPTRPGWPRAALGPGRPGGDLEEIALVTGQRLHVSRVLSSRPGEGLLLFADLDRTRANIALASLQVGRLAPAVLA